MNPKNPWPLDPILVVDDDEVVLRSLILGLRSEGFDHLVALSDGQQVLATLKKCSVELVLLDLSLRGMSGFDVLVQIHDQYPDVPVIIITGNKEVDVAVRCIRHGAVDYLVKPVEKGGLAASVRLAMQAVELRRVNRRLQEGYLDDRLRHPEAFSEMITGNERMRAVFRLLEAVSVSPEPVFITGETGVGKELVAGAVHRLSGRRGLFQSVNVAGLDDQMFSDTLFGHVKGAFTDAQAARAGLIAEAAGGTLFLDEIGDLPAQSQVKLLRFLQEKSYLPLGSDVPKRSDVRIVAATNQDLLALQKDGRFRRDLYYRLNVHHVHIPPLRERPDDLPLLVDHFLHEACVNLKRAFPEVSPELWRYLNHYPFPGNVRELRGLIIQAVSIMRGRQLPLSLFRQLKPGDVSGGEVGDLGAAGQIQFGRPLPTLRHTEDLLVAEALRRSNGNQSLAASMLGISRQAMHKRLKNSPSTGEQ